MAGFPAPNTPVYNTTSRSKTNPKLFPIFHILRITSLQSKFTDHKPAAASPSIGSAICLLTHADVMSQRNALISLPDRRFAITRQSIESSRPWRCWALQTTCRPWCPRSIHHFPRLVRRLLVRKLGALRVPELFIGVECNESQDQVDRE